MANPLNQTFATGACAPYVPSFDLPRFLHALNDVVREELVTRDEARAWIAALSPQFEAASKSKCCANCPR